MYCPNCGTEHSLDAAYCPSCGQQLSSANPTEMNGPAKQFGKSRNVLILVVIFVAAAVISAGVVAFAFPENSENSAQIKINVHSEGGYDVFINVYVDDKYYYCGDLYLGGTISELHTHKFPKSLSYDYIWIEVFTTGYAPDDSCSLYVYPDGYYTVDLYVNWTGHYD